MEICLEIAKSKNSSPFEKIKIVWKVQKLEKKNKKKKEMIQRK